MIKKHSQRVAKIKYSCIIRAFEQIKSLQRLSYIMTATRSKIATIANFDRNSLKNVKNHKKSTYNNKLNINTL